MKSFRLHTFAVLIVLILLTLGFAFYLTRAQLLNYEQTRLESRLCIELRRLSKDGLSVDKIDRMWQDMSTKLHLDDKSNIAFSNHRLHSDPSTELLQTPNWPVQKFEHQYDSDETHRDDSPSKSCGTHIRMIDGQKWIEAYDLSRDNGAALMLQRDAALREIDDVLRHTMKLFLALFLGLAMVTSLVFTRLLHSPILRLKLAMQRIDKHDLRSRIDAKNEFAEFQEMIESYNEMLDRLEASFQHASRFAANAAHELRTPLTILTGKLERAINRPGEETQKQEFASLLDQVSRLSSIVQKLLFLAQAEAGTFPIEQAPVNLSSNLEELLSDLQMLHEDALISVDIKKNVFVTGDQILLRQLLSNLLINAIKYSAPNAAISVSIGINNGHCEFTVTNQSEHLNKEDRDHFFEAFYRGISAQKSNAEGAGLGLNVANEIAKLHKGSIQLRETSAHIVSIEVLLPLLASNPKN